MRKATISSIAFVSLAALLFFTHVLGIETANARPLPPFESATVSTPGAAAGTAANTEIRPNMPKTAKRIYAKPLDLTVVRQDLVCGVTRDQERKMICIGDTVTGTIVEPIGQVTELFGNRIGTCARDESGLHCWRNSAKFEKPIEEIAGQAAGQSIRFTYTRFCVAQADHTILCHNAEQERWSTEAGRYIKVISPPETFGPFNALKDFEVNDRELCVIDGNSASCRFFADIDVSERNSSAVIPQRQLQNPRELTIEYGIFCIADDLGVVCTKGLESSSAKEIELGSDWIGASDLSASYENLCASSASKRPLCAKFNLTTGQPSDALPNSIKTILQNPAIKVLAFKSSGERLCLKLKNDGFASSELRCWMYGVEEKVPSTLGEVKDFVVAGQTCVVAENGWVSCFANGRYETAPLPKSPDLPSYFNGCSWNSLRFICDGEEVDSELSSVRQVIAVNQAPSIYNTCVLVEDQNGAIDIRCSGTEMAEIIRQRPALTTRPSGLSMTHTYGCIYGEDDLQCWGEPVGGQSTPNLSSVKKLLLGTSVGCALDKFGFICWGDLQNAGLEVPTPLTEPETVADFTLGQRHICVLSVDKKVSCWGGNDYGQTDVPDLNSPDQIKAAEFVTCASDLNGVTCWGLGQSSLGGETEPVPATPAGTP